MSDSLEPMQAKSATCTQCGAQLEFAPGAQTLECPYCGNKQEIERESAPYTAAEHALHEGLLKAQRVPAAQLATNAKESQCQRCGAVSVVTGHADHCAFCGSPVIVEVESTQDVFLPESVLPFVVESRAVKEKFTQWVAGLWFAPNNLKRLARSQRVDGVYLPYWTYDSQTETAYTGMRGETYYETQSYRDDKGNMQTRQVAKMRWYPRSGRVHVGFDDVLVCASESLPVELVDALEPWDFSKLRPFHPDFLRGFVAERYKVDLEGGWERAKVKMVPAIESSIRRDIGGDAQQIMSRSTAYDESTFKHLLLPLWVSSFLYQGKVYRFVCNATTGEIAGERPWSALKIAAAIVLGILLLVGAYYLYNRQR